LNLIHTLNITENAEEIHNTKQNTHDQNNTCTHGQQNLSVSLSLSISLSLTNTPHTFCEFIYICLDKLTSNEAAAALCGDVGDML
jgi:hypothetical protein